MASNEKMCPKIVDGIEKDVFGRKSRNLNLIAELLGIPVEDLYADARRDFWNHPDAGEIAEILRCFTSIKDPINRQKALDAAKKIALSEEN